MGAESLNRLEATGDFAFDGVSYRRSEKPEHAEPALENRCPRSMPSTSPAHGTPSTRRLRARTHDGAEPSELVGEQWVILWTLGARSGNVRKTPLVRVADGASYAVIGSMGGAPNNPNWVHNLRANPVANPGGSEVKELSVREVDGDEKAKWWSVATSVWPGLRRLPGGDRTGDPPLRARPQRNSSGRPAAALSAKAGDGKMIRQ